MNLGQWSGHQVFDLRTENCWPETQAALVFSCLLSAEIVETVNYTVIVWWRDKKNVIAKLYACVCVYPSHCCHNLTDWSADSTPVSLHCWYSSALTLAQRSNTNTTLLSAPASTLWWKEIWGVPWWHYTNLMAYWLLSNIGVSPSHLQLDEALIIPSFYGPYSDASKCDI